MSGPTRDRQGPSVPTPRTFHGWRVRRVPRHRYPVAVVHSAAASVPRLASTQAVAPGPSEVVNQGRNMFSPMQHCAFLVSVMCFAGCENRTLQSGLRNRTSGISLCFECEVQHLPPPDVRSSERRRLLECKITTSKDFPDHIRVGSAPLAFATEGSALLDASSEHGHPGEWRIAFIADPPQGLIVNLTGKTMFGPSFSISPGKSNEIPDIVLPGGFPRTFHIIMIENGVIRFRSNVLDSHRDSLNATLQAL